MRETMKVCLDVKKSTDALLRSAYGSLTARQYLILAAVSEFSASASLTEVARENRLSTQAARMFVNELEQQGLLNVVGSQSDDKRKITIRLTDSGEEIMRACPESYSEIDHELVKERLKKIMFDADRFFQEWACSFR
ncbi:MarR family transcriptional regulator [Raoultibacter phocaeensis]|uniref:MarR family transcriptional regulator n=1 Tax=Raoultibacter phocaeensis TaxID=2479841 RepID=UPI0011185E7C|nr:MarR family transcriptional regulator [Raoultibacter phocaeensis]